MWRMLQQRKPEDFVIATGEQRTVRQFVAAAAGELGMRVTWKGRGASEVGVLTDRGRKTTPRGHVRIDPRYYRRAEVDTLLGDPRKARRKLGWRARTRFADLVKEMVREDLRLAQRDALARKEGYRMDRRADQ
jgi:GDPmannose 4,6-dehydratase